MINSQNLTYPHNTVIQVSLHVGHRSYGHALGFVFVYLKHKREHKCYQIQIQKDDIPTVDLQVRLKAKRACDLYFQIYY